MNRRSFFATLAGAIVGPPAAKAIAPIARPKLQGAVLDVRLPPPFLLAPDYIGDDLDIVEWQSVNFYRPFSYLEPIEWSAERKISVIDPDGTKRTVTVNRGQ
jgi:hypothetical protein